MTLKEIAAQKTKELEAEKRRVLATVKNRLLGDVEFSREQLPRIQDSLARFDLFVKDHVDVINWEGLGGVPKSISDILFDLERSRNNVGALTKI
jgi:hypothetical protein